LLMELARSEGARRPSRISQFADVARFVFWNVGRLFTRRWRRYGRAAVVIGRPLPLVPWFESEPGLFDLARPERLAKVQRLSDEVMNTIGRLIPVTPVALACAAIQSLESDFLPRAALVRRMEEMRDALVELNGRVLRADRDINETFDRAWRMLRMRRMLTQDGDGYVVRSRGRPLISYYANSIAHLLGPFESAVRDRDTLPAMRLSAEFPTTRMG
jgi:glycerol-3-phosphate O-acyltransferase